MKKFGLARGLWLVGLGTGCALGQRLPAAAPTSSVASVPGASTAPATPVPAAAAPVSASAQAAKRARVTWAGGVLTIEAENSSLNGILRDVSQQTGMKITGGVADERVYGTYGPGPAEMVLGTLLTGTGSNVLLKENTPARPMELVLTPRQGGPTPAGPSTYAREREERMDDLPPQRMRPGRTEERAGEAPVNGGMGRNGADANQPASVAPAATATTDQQSPNGVKTPQQIYDQLMKLQQQQKATPPPL